MSTEYIKTKIDEASRGFTDSANHFKEARENNRGLEILAEARGIFAKIMDLSMVLKADHVEALGTLESGIAHAQTALDVMQDTGDFIRPGDEASMMTHTRRALHEAGVARQTTKASLSKYDNELSKDTWAGDKTLLGRHEESLGYVTRFLDEAINKHDEVLTALANYKTQI